MKKLKVNLSIDSHSTGRGIGFYANNLKVALEQRKDLTLTDQDHDLIHYPYFDLFYPTLKVGGTPTLVTIHDLTPLVLGHLYPKGIRGSVNFFRQKLALNKVVGILTDSQNSKQDISKFLNFPEEKIHVTPLAVDPIYLTKPSPKTITAVKKKYALPDQFVLYVGGVNPNKNLPRLIQACLDLNLNLILVGSEFTKDLNAIHAELKDFRLVKIALQKHPNQIKALGFVQSEELLAIYNLATLYCQPSLYEGFGLPLLEAMTAGCLIASSNASSLPEIYPQGSLNFDPENQISINACLETALNLKPGEKQALISKAKTKAKNYSWAKTAELTASVYRSLF